MSLHHNPLVSIVIPVYNGSNYLHEAIESALAQTYHNIEIIVVNDGSNDDGKTEQIALSYGKQVKYLAKENGGVATALNMAIEHMQGEYFSWLSHDDVYYPQKIQTQIEYLEAYGNEQTIVYSDYDTIDSKSNIIGSYVLDHKLLINKPLYGLLGTFIHGCSLLIPREVFDKNGLFDTDLRYTQDYDFFCKLAKKYNFTHMDERLIQSRSHPQQDSNKHSQDPREGNTLWTKCVDNLQDDEILQCEKSKALFYLKMAIILKRKPYSLAYRHSIQLAHNEAPFFSFFAYQYLLVGFYLKKINSIIFRNMKRLTSQHHQGKRNV